MKQKSKRNQSEKFSPSEQDVIASNKFQEINNVKETHTKKSFSRKRKQRKLSDEEENEIKEEKLDEEKEFSLNKAESDAENNAPKRKKLKSNSCEKHLSENKGKNINSEHLQATIKLEKPTEGQGSPPLVSVTPEDNRAEIIEAIIQAINRVNTKHTGWSTQSTTEKNIDKFINYILALNTPPKSKGAYFKKAAKFLFEYELSGYIVPFIETQL